MLCSFYDASLNTVCRALSSEDGPRADFSAFVEWTLARNGFPLTVCPEEDLASATPDPEPSQPPPSCAELPEPTADGEPEPAAVESSPSGAIERTTTQEPEPETSDQVREPATVEIAGAMESPAHTATAEAPLALSPEDPSSPSPASDPRTPPGPSDPAAAPWHLAPSSPPSPVDPPAPPGSLVPTAPPRSVVTLPSPLDSTPPAAPRRSVPPARLDSSFPPAPPRSSIAQAPLRLSASVAGAICFALALRILGVAPDLRLFVSASGCTTTCSTAVGRPPGVVSPSSTMAPPSVDSTVGCHLGCGLGPTWLLLLQIPPVVSLAPPSG
ncbi:hypothetical protein QQF64_007866 [Cirrhinus molitorella]|uniref:Vegetative cell wall protein gp1-like n=1 Tax=Cirrhinus molitorella TaxID=172907 RepID=A0ABR3M7Z2_9TELE